MNTVVGLFDNYEDADKAVQALHDYGVYDQHISIVTRGDQKLEHGTVTAGTGAAAGAATGGLVGLLAGLSALLVPGIGPVLATGAIASALGMTAVGAGVGAAAGGLLGALIHAGVSQEDAEFYTEGVKRGGVLVSVETEPENQDQVNDILRSAGAVEMESRRQSWVDEGVDKYEPADRYKDEPFRR